MGIGRTGGAGQVWPDSNINYLSKQTAQNGESSDIPLDSIVSLRSTNNGSAMEAFLANGSISSYYTGSWAVAKGGFGSTTGNKQGTVVQWALADIDTSASAVDAPVYVNAGAAGVATLTAGTKAVVVGKVLRVGASATDTKNTVLLAPELFKGLGNPAEMQDVAGGNTFAQASLILASGGTCTMDPAGTRTILDPTVQGQTMTFVTTDVNTPVVTYAGGWNAAVQQNLSLNAAASWATVMALPVGPAGALRWRVLATEGVTIS
jgi:hypothetical protein